MGSAGSEVHTGTREAKGQAHSACNRTGGSEIRAGFLEEVAARLSPHRKARAKSRGSLPAWAQRRLEGGDGRGVGTRLGGGVGRGKPSLLAVGCLPSLCLREGGWAAGPQRSRLQTKRKGWLLASATSGRHNPSCSGHTRSRIRISRLWPCLISLIKPKVAVRHFGLKKKKKLKHTPPAPEGQDKGALGAARGAVLAPGSAHRRCDASSGPTQRGCTQTAGPLEAPCPETRMSLSQERPGQHLE